MVKEETNAVVLMKIFDANKESGFTLVELLITMTILAIMATMVVPSMSQIMESNQTTSVSNNLAKAFATARSKAVSSNRSVTIRSDGDSFVEGWCIYLGDHDQSCGGGNMVEVGSSSAQGLEVSGLKQGRVVFASNGTPSSHTSGITTVIRPKDCQNDNQMERHVVIDQTGRAEVNRVDC